MDMKYFIEGIKNIIKWIPIIYHDRDYDHAYVEYILYFKLKNMYNRFSDPTKTYVDWTTEDSSKALKALGICVKILERRKDDWYTNYWWDNGRTNEDLPISDELEKRDWSVFCKLMNKYFFYWWD